MIPNIHHPRKEVVPLAVGLEWSVAALYQEKCDGRFAAREWRGNLLAGELMAAGNFIAWDLLYSASAGDVRGNRAIDRFTALICARELMASDGIELVRFTTDRGGEFLESVLRTGGEGVCRKELGATYFDTMTACKRIQTWRCVVTALDYATGGASIADAVTGESRGTCPLRNRSSQCRVGSLIKVEGENLSAGGKILKPRPCKDTATSWLVQF